MSERAAILAIAFAACARAAPPPRCPETPVPRVASPEPPRLPPPVPVVPDGYVEMRVARVVVLPQGNAVLLATEGEGAVLPIFVGETEALSIDRRLAQQPFERPLTHDLLDAALRELGGRVTEVHVDAIRAGTFIGTLFVRAASRVLQLDARPSDAIALALGARAPIYVSRAVLATAGIPLPPEAPAPSTF